MIRITLVQMINMTTLDDDNTDMFNSNNEGDDIQVLCLISLALPACGIGLRGSVTGG